MEEVRDIKKALRLSTLDYYHTHLMLINCIIPIDARMTPKEIELLASFMSLEGDLALHRFGPTARKIVMGQMKISPAGLSNYITSLIEKGILSKTGDMLTILPLLHPDKDKQGYRFMLLNMGTPQIPQAQPLL